MLMSGLAPGADVMAFDAALSLGWPVHVMLPAPVEQCDRQSLADPRLLSRAAAFTVIDVREGHHAYAAMAEALIDAADMLVAVYDRGGSAGPGGTADVIARARARSLEVVEIRV